jgi:pilus assembly protein CpaC
LIIAALVAVPVVVQSPQTAQAEPGHRSYLKVPAAIGRHLTRDVTVGLSKSLVVELPRDVRDVLVSDPKKLDAVVNSSRRVYLIGVEVGQANVFFFDSNGDQMLTLEVRVERDLAAVTRMLHKLLPGANIKLESVNDNIILTGSVQNPSDASRAADLVSRMVEEREKVLNMLAVGAKEQVLLKVTVVEMERTIIKQLGVDLSNFSGTAGAFFTSGNFTFAKFQNLAFPFNDKDTVSRSFSTFAHQTGSSETAAVLRALEQNGLVRTLAEPTLTAISGETANFLAGGEFPIPVSQDNDRVSVEFKPFGVGLSFTPMVMSEGRISMKVSTEVSELTNDGSVTLGVISIPGLKVRRANTTIELPSGGSLVIAGLISEESKQAMTGQPGVKNLPILGALFRSRDFIKSETELVVIATPYIINPVARQELARPDGGFALPSDTRGYLLGQINRIYGDRPEQLPVGRYEGDYGFIIE